MDETESAHPALANTLIIIILTHARVLSGHKATWGLHTTGDLVDGHVQLLLLEQLLDLFGVEALEHVLSDFKFFVEIVQKPDVIVH